MFDISEIAELSGEAVNSGLDMELKHPVTGEKTGAIWSITSYESDVYKAVERRLRTKGMKAIRTNKVTAEMADENTLELIASLVVDWRGMEEDGKPMPFSREALNKLLRLPIAGANFIEQVDAFASDNEAFFKASQKPSAMPSATK